MACVCAGGSLCTCLDALIARGVAVSNLRVVGVVAAPPALKRLSENYPGAFALHACVLGRSTLMPHAQDFGFTWP
jgi:uracil phosphoribosyltransferase